MLINESIKVFSYPPTGQAGFNQEIVPKPTDILLFGNETAVVEQWDDKCIKLQALQYDYIDRGWLVRFLEKIKLIRPKFKYREIDFRETAYLIGNTHKEN